MAERTCSEDGCDRPYVARGWCRKHYMRWYNSPGSGAGGLQKRVNGGRCSIDGCDKTAESRGWCAMHYRRWKQHGDPLVSLLAWTGPQSGDCSIADCRKPAEKRSWCGLHYRRWHRHGDPTFTNWIIPAPGGNCLRCGSPELMPQSRRFCSPRCQQAYTRSLIPKPDLPILRCSDCTAPFQKPARYGPAAGPRRCPPCAEAYRAERDREDARRRRARRYAAPSERFRDQEIFERDGWVCQLCDEPVEQGLRWPDPLMATIDHVQPLALGGHHSRANCQLAHLSCNVRKGARGTYPVAAEVVMPGG